MHLFLCSNFSKKEMANYGKLKKKAKKVVWMKKYLVKIHLIFIYNIRNKKIEATDRLLKSKNMTNLSNRSKFFGVNATVHRHKKGSLDL